MKARRELLMLIGAGIALLAQLPVSFAQPKGKLWRIGFLGATSAASYASRVEALRAGLRELGYVEGKNITIEFRWADGKYERLPDLAAELVKLKVDMIVTHGTPGTRAAKQATASIPIVMAISGDAVATGIVASVARPGGNVTGATFFNPELAAKRLEMLKETLPRATRIAVLLNPDNPINGPVVREMELTAKVLKLQLEQTAVRGAHELAGAIAAMAAKRVDGVAIVDDAMLQANAALVAELLAKNRLPAIGQAEFGAAGCLLGYGVNQLDIWRRAAVFVDKIVKGAKPADLPIERSTQFELIANRKTAAALGITLPQAILVRAEKVIE